MDVKLHNAQVKRQIEELKRKKTRWEELLSLAEKLESFNPYSHAYKAWEDTCEKISWWEALIIK
jgi:hypothetical protein